MLSSKGNTTLPKHVSIIDAVAVILNGTLVILVDSWRALVQKISRQGLSFLLRYENALMILLFLLQRSDLTS